jgi:hypothetical protein
MSTARRCVTGFKSSIAALDKNSPNGKTEDWCVGINLFTILEYQQLTSRRVQVINAIKYRRLSKSRHRKRYEPWFVIRNNLYQSETG